MKLEMEEMGHVAIVTPEGDVLDANNSPEFKQDVSSILESKSQVVFDMSGLRFIDSSGCGALLSCLRKLNSKGGDLKLFGLSEQVRSLFQIIRLDQILGTHETREDALKAFQDQESE